MNTVSLKNLLLPGLLAILLVAVPLAYGGNGEDTGYNFETIVLGDCQVGNLNPPMGPPVPEIFQGDEAYAFYIFPAHQCDCSEGGFELESVTQLLEFDQLQIPATLVVQGALLKAVVDGTTGCYVPGPILHEGPLQTITIMDNGPVAIQVPTPGSPAFPVADHYFLVLRYEGGAQGQLLVDDLPQQCTEYVNRGSGWVDLFGRDRSGGGKVIVFGDIVCSPMGVGDTSTSWDGIKSLYK